MSRFGPSLVALAAMLVVPFPGLAQAQRAGICAKSFHAFNLSRPPLSPDEVRESWNSDLAFWDTELSDKDAGILRVGYEFPVPGWTKATATAWLEERHGEAPSKELPGLSGRLRLLHHDPDPLCRPDTLTPTVVEESATETRPAASVLHCLCAEGAACESFVDHRTLHLVGDILRLDRQTVPYLTEQTVLLPQDTYAEITIDAREVVIAEPVFAGAARLRILADRVRFERGGSIVLAPKPDADGDGLEIIAREIDLRAPSQDPYQPHPFDFSTRDWDSLESGGAEWEGERTFLLSAERLLLHQPRDLETHLVAEARRLTLDRKRSRLEVLSEAPGYCLAVGSLDFHSGQTSAPPSPLGGGCPAQVPGYAETLRAEMLWPFALASKAIAHFSRNPYDPARNDFLETLLGEHLQRWEGERLSMPIAQMNRLRQAIRAGTDLRGSPATYVPRKVIAEQVEEAEEQLSHMQAALEGLVDELTSIRGGHSYLASLDSPYPWKSSGSAKNGNPVDELERAERRARRHLDRLRREGRGILARFREAEQRRADLVEAHEKEVRLFEKWLEQEKGHAEDKLVTIEAVQYAATAVAAIYAPGAIPAIAGGGELARQGVVSSFTCDSPETAAEWLKRISKAGEKGAAAGKACQKARKLVAGLVDPRDGKDSSNELGELVKRTGEAAAATSGCLEALRLERPDWSRGEDCDRSSEGVDYYADLIRRVDLELEALEIDLHQNSQAQARASLEVLDARAGQNLLKSRGRLLNGPKLIRSQMLVNSLISETLARMGEIYSALRRSYAYYSVPGGWNSGETFVDEELGATAEFPDLLTKLRAQVNADLLAQRDTRSFLTEEDGHAVPELGERLKRLVEGQSLRTGILIRRIQDRSDELETRRWWESANQVTLEIDAEAGPKKLAFLRAVNTEIRRQMSVIRHRWRRGEESAFPQKTFLLLPTAFPSDPQISGSGARLVDFDFEIEPTSPFRDLHLGLTLVHPGSGVVPLDSQPEARCLEVTFEPPGESSGGSHVLKSRRTYPADTATPLFDRQSRDRDSYIQPPVITDYFLGIQVTRTRQDDDFSAWDAPPEVARLRVVYKIVEGL